MKFTIILKNNGGIMQYDKIKGIARGARLAEFLQKAFPGLKEVRRNEAFGFPNSTVRLWISGSDIRDEALLKLELLGCNMIWLLTGEGEMFLPGHGKTDTLPATVSHAGQQPEPPEPVAIRHLEAPPNSRRMKVRRKKPGTYAWWETGIQTWGITKPHAANSHGGVNVDMVHEAFEEEEPPEGLTLVPVKGDSMEPVILDGQYAQIDKSREGFIGGGWIYAMAITDEDGGVTTNIKRCRRHGDEYVCTSINKTHKPFNVKAANCQMWPVIGVWFAGKGRVREED